MGLQIDLHAKLKEYFGFDSFKGNQEEIIKNVLAGNNTFVLMPTGGGKSLCYQLPALILDGTAIVISPLIALMKNQVDAMRSFSASEGVAHFMNSSLSKSDILSVKEDVLSGKTKLLYVAPESLTKESNVEFLRKVRISFFAVDEAHCISEWGHDFRTEYRKIRPIVEQIGKAPIIALTATATPKVQHDIQKNLDMLDAQVFKSSFNRSNLYYEVRPKTDPAKDIIKFIKNNEGKSGIIYCLSRKKVEELTELLCVNGIKAASYHAGMDAAARSSNQDKFLMEEVNVIVATIAFGMGIDKPDVRFVIHYDIPKSLEGYYQETGRAGRDGGEGYCLTFYSYKDIQKLEKFMQGKPIAEQEIGKQLLMETVSYAETSLCRRKVLLHYFGENYDEENCGACDNCLYPKKEFEGKEFLIDALNAVLEVKEKFKVDHLVKVLIGETDSMIKSYHHDELESFGIGSDKSSQFWNMVFRRALISNYIEKDIEQYGVIKLSKEGHEFLKEPKDFMLMEDHNFEESEEKLQEKGGVSALDNTLFAILKDLRKKIAKKNNLPPYVIFQDPSLEDMCTNYPITLEELANIQGVGTGKAQKYGQEFVEVIKQYVEDNEIERAQDLVVKTVANKSKFKVYIIQNIDRQIDLEDIASAEGLTFEELIKEMEAIVFSGTKLNIDYYINKILDDEQQQEIMDYFMEAKSDNIGDAYDEFDGDYSEEDLRLMRLKLHSKHGN
ncbi:MULTISPECIES: DNA helicase RecQ [Butyricimonas]|uniref:DNA helicase RecQ n=1 Tax=Butyricimonas hominis TaxID=2763032 RepID=A0ABR7D7E9_9BACT|nr:MULTISPECIES: DNA helicase RecQ [Butyricimonas]MBC5623425.1 DNA helicase RecQ [Butyricimonas hominis]MCB6973243.1 DNA helicase RecQ [Butyricimonas synergistica]MCG4519839.1 DNA helicase RecQ [Butyricimonas sp. DFI.6.44]